MKQREYTHGEKARADSKSGYRGVQSHRCPTTGDERHQAYISDPATKKRITLGSFHDKKLAAKARDEAARHFYGVDAILNFPESESRGSFGSGWKLKSTPNPAIPCKTCGTMFAARSPTHLYCNPKCRVSAKTPKAGRWIVLNRDKFRCLYCGRASWDNPNLVMHVDHVHPVADGGKNTLSNLVTSCGSCNEVKSNTILENEEEILAIVESRNEKSGLNPKIIIKFSRR